MIVTKDKHNQEVKIDEKHLADAIIKEMLSIAAVEDYKTRAISSALILLLQGCDRQELQDTFEECAIYVSSEFKEYTGSDLGAQIAGEVQKHMRRVGLFGQGRTTGLAMWNLMHGCNSWWQAWQWVFSGNASEFEIYAT